MAGHPRPCKPRPQTLHSLPDYLRTNLDIVLVGLNPGRYSAQVGRYFARKQNRFWTALSASGLVPEPLGPGDEERLLDWGIGLTDVVKRPTGGIHELGADEFRRGARQLHKKIVRYSPRIVCFNGLTGYRACCGTKQARVGRQTERFGGVRVFALPSTSPRNAHYSLADIISAMQDLGRLRDELKDRRQH